MNSVVKQLPMESKLDIWNTHEWYSRRLEIEPGRPQMQRYCIRCGRNFVEDLWCNDRYAAHAAIFHFDRLDDEVTERWLREPCPGIHLPSDDNDRKLLAEPSAAPAQSDHVVSISRLRRKSG